VDSTAIRSLVLSVRLLFPDSREEMQNFVAFNIKAEQACGLTDDDFFNRLWDTPHNFAKDSHYTKSIRQHLEISFLSHPFVCDVIPEKMGYPLLKYEKRKDDLWFTLDDGTNPSRKY
jgi:hypothetical protein